MVRMVSIPLWVALAVCRDREFWRYPSSRFMAAWSLSIRLFRPACGRRSTAGSTAAGIARRPTAAGDPSRPRRASRPAPGLELSRQKIVRCREFPDLRVQVAHGLRVHLGRLARHPLLEDLGRACEQTLLPLVDQHRVHLEPRRKLGHRMLTLQSLQRHLRLKRGRVPLPLRHLIRLLLEDQDDLKS